VFASSRTIQWIENLADQEGQICSGRRSSLDLSSTKESLLAGETLFFLEELHSGIDYLVSVFNARVSGECELRVQATSRPSGFSISRNGVRLSVHLHRPGLIQFLCDKHASDSETSWESRSYRLFSGTVEAQFGNFNEVEWASLGSVVTPEQVVRHYLTEFIQVSRVPS
jgi:hypothetical protein